MLWALVSLALSMSQADCSREKSSVIPMLWGSWEPHMTVASNHSLWDHHLHGMLPKRGHALPLLGASTPVHTFLPSWRRLSSSFDLFSQRNTLSQFPLWDTYNTPSMSLDIYKTQEETWTSASSVFCPGKIPKAMK